MSAVHPLSESEAREILLQEQSEASNPNYFDAERREHGWVFGWREDRGDIPVGTHTWIVADNGRVKMLGHRERIDTAIEDEIARPASSDPTK
jgi:hypothetical protein